MTTIKDVAKVAQVSIATVSYVLNNTGKVSEETRQRVLQVVREIGYRPSVNGQSLQAGQSRILGYSWQPTPANLFHPILQKFLYAIVAAAGEQNYHILTFPYAQTNRDITPYKDLIASGRVDGFILADTGFDDHRISMLMKEGFPFVTFGRANPAWNFSWVDVDGQVGIKQAVSHLAELGHQRIGFLGWPPFSPAGDNRLQGYSDQMAALGLPTPSHFIKRTINQLAEAATATQEWLVLPNHERPTAIIGVSDLVAVGAMHAIIDRGLQVGRDIAVVGFDDSPVTDLIKPTLTSIRQPIEAVGERMITMILDLIAGKQPTPAQVLLAPTLIVRESTVPR